MSISNFFKNTLGANLTNSRWSWGAYNPKTNQFFLRVWEDGLEYINGIECIQILRSERDSKSAGYPERKRHILALRNGAEGYGVLCVAKENYTKGNRKIEKFDKDYLLKFGGIIEENNHISAQIIDRVPTYDLAQRRTSQSTLIPELKEIISKRKDATTKESMISARVGQGEFRSQVLKIWDSKCCVTGSSIQDAVRASHIKPWRDSDNYERLDANNGLPLIATLDALFDAGLISFNQDGKLISSSKLDSKEKKLLGLNNLKLKKIPNKQTIIYLEYHYDNIL